MRTICAAAVCALLCSAPLFAGGTPDGGPRLRPQDARIKAAITEGMGRSATFKALVDQAQGEIERGVFRPGRTDDDMTVMVELAPGGSAAAGEPADLVAGGDEQDLRHRNLPLDVDVLERAWPPVALGAARGLRRCFVLSLRVVETAEGVERIGERFQALRIVRFVLQQLLLHLACLIQFLFGGLAVSHDLRDEADAKMSCRYLVANGRFAAALLKEILVVLQRFFEQIFAQGLHSGLVQQFVLAHAREQLIDHLQSALQSRLRNSQRRSRVPIADDDRQQSCDRQYHRGAGEDRGKRIATTPTPQTLRCSHRTGHDRDAVQVAVQVLGQRRAGMVTTRWLFLQAFDADRFQIAIDCRVQLAWRNRFLIEDLSDRFRDVRCLKRRATGKQSIQRRAQRIQIGRGSDTRRVLGLLGRHVRWRPHHLPGEGQRFFALRELRQAKVGDQRPVSRLLDHDVLRLQVAVQHAAGVQVGERGGITTKLSGAMLNASDQNPRIGAQIAERLNTTFHTTADPNLKVADAKNRELIVVNVPTELEQPALAQISKVMAPVSFVSGSLKVAVSCGVAVFSTAPSTGAVRTGENPPRRVRKLKASPK